MTDAAVRFRQAMDGLPDPGHRLAVAVSGGPDSMALAILLRDWCADTARGLTALIVDHGLRDGSAMEAELVSGRLASFAVPNRILRWDGPKPVAGLQAGARDARYRLMSGWCRRQGTGSLFVAHHADDQAATVAMRIARGSGIDGLGAMRAVTNRDGIRIVRPLLAVPKTDLIALLRERGLPWVEDPTNQDPRHERNRIDAELADHAEPERNRMRLNRLAVRAARASDALQQWTDALWHELAVTGIAGDVTLDLAAFRAVPEEIRLRLLLRAAAQAGGLQPGLETAERALERLSGEGGAPALTLGHALVRRSATRLHVVRERRNLPVNDWSPGGSRSLLWDGRFRLDATGPLPGRVTIGPGHSDAALLPFIYRDSEPLGCPLPGPVTLADSVQVRATALFSAPR